jgi:hypothetical protein
MRTLAPALGCLLLAAKASIACSVVEVVEIHPSSPNLRITVLKEGTAQQNAAIVVSLQANAQQVGPPLKTDGHGRAELRNLPSGTYCITATADPRLGAILCLAVSKGHDHERSEFSMKLASLPPRPPTLAEQLAEAAKSPPQARAREFEGIVTDVTGAFIPHAKVVVYVGRSGKGPNLVSLEADDAGRFSVSLSPGNYTAAFQSPGFRTRLMSFTIWPDESQELAPIVLQAGTCT